MWTSDIVISQEKSIDRIYFANMKQKILFTENLRVMEHLISIL